MMNIRDWFIKEGCKILESKWKQSLRGNIKDYMKNWEIREDFIAMNMDYEQMMQIGNKYAKGKQISPERSEPDGRI